MLRAGEEMIVSADAGPKWYYAKYCLALFAGSAAGTVAFSAKVASGVVCTVLGHVVALAVWTTWTTAMRGYPLVRPGAIGITNRRFIARDPEIVAQHPLAEYQSHSFRRGFPRSAAFSAELVIRFQDGDKWRVSQRLMYGGLDDFANALTELTSDD